MKRYILLLLIFASCSTEQPTVDLYAECYPELWVDLSEKEMTEGRVEGDILVNFHKGAVVKNKTLLWGDTIPFAFQDDYQYGEYLIPGVAEKDRDNIRAATYEFGRLTGKVFIEYDNAKEMKKEHPDGILYTPGFGFGSYLGKQGGIQKIYTVGADPNFPSSMAYQFIAIMHELGHGVYAWLHEQNRTDRDQYVNINFENILDGKASEFEPYPNTQDCGEYDFYSIMHYRFDAFSKNGEATITRKDGSKIPNNSTLSEGDIKLAHILNETQL